MNSGWSRCMSANQELRPMTKAAVIRELARMNGLTQAKVKEFFTQLTLIIERELSKEGPGVFNFDGLVEIKAFRVPARPEHTALHPFTKEPIVILGKPARHGVRLRRLKKLDDLLA